MGFKDHFSARACGYARYRPGYPPELFAYLASVTPGRRRAFDCATGSGQAAVALTEHFEWVIAAEASAAQLARAATHPRVSYLRAFAEQTVLVAGSVELVTVAQALHWFEIDRFYAEVERIAAPGGVLAVWCYGAFTAADGLGEALHRFHYQRVGPYWPPERRYIEEGYRTIPFPPPGWQELEPPGFEMAVEWTLPELLGYLGTWSASRRFREATGEEPVELARAELTAAWGTAERRRIAWPLSLRMAWR